MTSDEVDDFTSYVHRTTRQFTAIAYLLTGDQGRAEDLTQTAYAKTYVAWRRIRMEDPYAFTRRILLNSHIDWWRRRSRLEVPVAGLREPAPQPDFASVVIDRQELADAMSRLTRRERLVVVLRYFLDLPSDSVAAQLGVTTGTVKSTASRALGKLRADPVFAASGRIPQPEGVADV
ncbi:SigE family RNA polymerase sigma factor [Fodinicola feengrottensis]|uniref:SigE family RNA polymerase sigma factor n=1 Tax=Fodinicola feengrottensis TaxID=435914 RepID=A0ABN2G175_9ACTN|nr:SigE family RNA polymerase sigma factor [Fodinicola feengrottensis]